MLQVFRLTLYWVDTSHTHVVLLQVLSLLLLLVFAAIAAFSCYRALSQKVRHKVGHASEVARHAGRSLFMLMGGARRKERLTSSLARKDVTGARC